MKKALSIIAIVLAILLAIGAALLLVFENPVGQFLGRGYAVMGDRLERDGQYEEALRMYGKAIASDPSNAKYFIHRAAIEYRMGNYREAVAAASRAIELDPKDPVGWTWRGYAEKYLEQLQPAYDDLSKAIDLSPQNTSDILERAEVSDKMNDFPAALADIDRVLKLYPKDAWAFNARATIDQDMGDLAKAAIDVDEAERLDHGAARIRVHRGWVLLCQENYDAAFCEAQDALDSSSRDSNAIFLMGVAQERQGHADLAKSTFDRLLELDPRYNARAERGVAEYDLGKLDAAWGNFEAAKERTDAKGKARLWLWIVDNERGHPDRANRDLSTWVDAGESAVAEERRSIAQVMLGRKTPQDFDAFANAMKSPLRKQQFTGELWFFTAKAALIRGDRATALVDFQKMIDSKATSIDEYTEAQREMTRLAASAGTATAAPATPTNETMPLRKAL